jgi:N-carbamoyl-L-amino-acid hydrolase
VKINGERLLSDLEELRGFGARDSGVVRQAFSEVDLESRRWLMAKMQSAGLNAVIDGVGNVLGTAPDSTRALLMGSHSDTQPEGGWLDGAMGVIYALEIARAAREQCGDSYPIDVASWMDEEGHYLTCLGSRSFCGKLPESEIDAAVNPEGRPLREAIREAGLGNAPAARLDSSRHVAYLEAHIEQGCVLENLGKRIGVVSSIVGGAAFRVVIIGQQNHAGTTPMSMRRDAGVAFVDLAHRIRAEFSRIARNSTVWTIGDVRFFPGALNTIPGRSEFVLEFRDVDEERIRQLAVRLHELVDAANGDGRVEVKTVPLGDAIPPAHMSAAIRQYIAAAAERNVPGGWMTLPSGAGHDAAIFADLIPSGMLFVPSMAGISHSFLENTANEDIVLGCRVMAESAISLLAAVL